MKISMKEFISDRLQNYIAEIVENFDEISVSRKEELSGVASYMKEQLSHGKALKFTFICTHNSRRSHYSQIWAQTAAFFYDVQMECYSGGTEATAFNYRAVEAMKRAGFTILQNEPADNPLYEVSFSKQAPHIPAFSKKYTDPFNPQEGYAALMTCSHADENCPVIYGADTRFPINYEDPKEYDDTPQEKEFYDLRCKQIAVEMFFMLSEVT